MSSHPLFWPSGRKLFRQHPRGRRVWLSTCVVALAAVAAALLKLGWI